MEVEEGALGFMRERERERARPPSTLDRERASTFLPLSERINREKREREENFVDVRRLPF